MKKILQKCFLYQKYAAKTKQKKLFFQRFLAEKLMGLVQNNCGEKR